jgi:hypothetical protein
MGFAMKRQLALYRVGVLLLVMLATAVGPILISYLGLVGMPLWRKRYSTVGMDDSGQSFMFAFGKKSSLFSTQTHVLFGVLPSNYDPATMFLDRPDVCPQSHLFDVAKRETPRIRQRISSLNGLVVGIDAGFPFRTIGSIRFERHGDHGFDPAEYRPASTIWQRWYSSGELKQIKNYVEPRDHLYWWSPLAIILNLAFWIGFAFVLLNAKKWLLALRTFVRTRRGLCHVCCYNVSTLPDAQKCPECGAEVRRREVVS